MNPSKEWLDHHPGAFDLGHGHWGLYSAWAPDRKLNPQFVMWPDVEKWGLTIYHDNPQGGPCAGFVTFAGDVQRQVSPDQVTWSVISWEPLTIAPSVLCSCGDHGFIREGMWVPA